MNDDLRKRRGVQVTLRLSWNGEPSLVESRVQSSEQCISGSPSWYPGVKALVLLFTYARWRWLTGCEGRYAIFGKAAKPLFEYVRKKDSSRQWAGEFAGVVPATRQDVLRLMLYHEGSPPRPGEYWTNQAVHLDTLYLHPENIGLIVDDRQISDHPDALWLHIKAIRLMFEDPDRSAPYMHKGIGQCRQAWQRLMWTIPVPGEVLDHLYPLFAQ